jgi:CubicO group peptidase (beta-lactamase class C family)
VRRFIRYSRNIFIGILVLYLLLYATTRILRIPEPVTSIRIGLAQSSETPTLLPFHTVRGSDLPKTWVIGEKQAPRNVAWNGETIPFNDYLRSTHTNAFLIIRHGAIAYEWYKEGFSKNYKFPSYSIAKTLTSLIIGKMISQGKIEESDTFIKFFPEFRAKTSFDRITVKNLLDMESGVAVYDEYPKGLTDWVTPISQMYLSTDLNDFLKHNRTMAWKPGSRSEYRSIDTLMLGFIIKKVSGMSVADYFSENLWQPIGAEATAIWNVDHVGGLEKTFCCFNATARDFARIGQVILDDGVVAENGLRVIDSRWMKRLSQTVSTLPPGWGYGAQMWHPFPDALAMIGLHGQFIYVQPEADAVIVKLSDEPTDNKDNTVLSLYVFRELLAYDN